ncbi:bifunctional glutamate--cysteine ligase GshA/glutathione synthetase GshB [Loigolactobacillus iwatensis]|uniref:bifunctional glutamate--cysteine ligase GshA/glutathione synthetase GshB n=1 Tax=Loigolactobacillus iwatensis TaxID=1267156 RepID=UPI000F7E3832|nr:bifunctional glutamate--cysteine ligase GshA/glutathione synthetase GshB [Loigolactobacillus iwatensis]
MLNHFGKQIQKFQRFPFLYEGQFGLEKEVQRVTTAGELVTTKYPASLSLSQGQPYLKPNFTTTQIKVVTDRFSSIHEMYHQLQGLDDVLTQNLATAERLWPLSMPPKLPDDQAIKLTTQERAHYKQPVSKRSLKSQMIAAIRLNFSLPTRLLLVLYEDHYQDKYDSYLEFHNAAYLKVAQNYQHYRYILTYLFGASPLAEMNFYQSGQAKPAKLVRSLANSQRYGYANQTASQISFASLAQYVQDITTCVKQEKLANSREFNVPVLLQGRELSKLTSEGVTHLELRNLELDPFALDGISEDDLDFMQAFVIYMLILPSIAQQKVSSILQTAAEQNEQVALEDPTRASALQVPLTEFIQGMQKFVVDFAAPKRLQTAVNRMAERVIDFKKTPAYLLSQQVSQQSLSHFAVKQANTTYNDQTQVVYQLRGYQDLSLSTQALLRAAIQVGLHVEVLDRQDNLIRLSYQKQSEIVKQGSLTSKGNQLSGELSANKTVLKKLLGEAGFAVPMSAEYQTQAAALTDFSDYAKRGIVVKPRCGHNGAGVTVFKLPPKRAAYAAAVSTAFKFDQTIMVESFVVGSQYRFLVISGKVKAVLEQTPANVVGDGRLTIQQLIEKKNLTRGENQTKPLEKIPLDGPTAANLTQQGLQLTTIPVRGNLVYLGDTANPITGGDSVDMTTDVDVSYCHLAERVAAELKLTVAGIDLFIDNPYKAVTDEHPELGMVLSVTNQPSLIEHLFPYYGEAQPVAQQLLQSLFPKAFH